MEKTGKIGTILALAVASCFVMVSLAQGGSLQTDDKNWIKKNLPNRSKMVNIPIWGITQGGTEWSVTWVDHVSNRRFAIYDPGTPGDESDDVVLDKETGLVWERSPTITTTDWHNATDGCYNKYLGGRMGWRLPTVEELASLVDPTQAPQTLPNGHPFIGVQSYAYWSSTTDAFDTSYVWCVHLANGGVYHFPKSNSYNVWGVWGGQGHDGGGNEDVINLLQTEVIPKLGAGAPVEKTGQTTCYDESGTVIPCSGTGQDGEYQKGVAWPTPRFTDNGDGTVTDNLTGLMWTKNANIYGTRFLSQALSDCASCTEGGHSDWYLPNRRELESLVHCGFFNPALPNTAGTGQWSEGDPFTGVQSNNYWSSTTSATDTRDAWIVIFYSGIVDYYYKNEPAYVWCVRGGR